MSSSLAHYHSLFAPFISFPASCQMAYAEWHYTKWCVPLQCPATSSAKGRLAVSGFCLSYILYVTFSPRWMFNNVMPARQMVPVFRWHCVYSPTLLNHLLRAQVPTRPVPSDFTTRHNHPRLEAISSFTAIVLDT